MPRSAVPVVSSLVVLAVLSGCGGGDNVSSSSLDPRLLSASAIPGFVQERKLDWSDPVNLVGEGIAIPQNTHPSDAVKKFQKSHLEGAAGEVLRKGAGLGATEVVVGVAKFKSDGDATSVAKWMHNQDLQQPCFSECAFAPQQTTVPGAPGVQFVVQTAPAVVRPLPGAKTKGPRKLPHGLPQSANYLAEFTSGPYLYWADLRGSDSTAKRKVEAGLKAYYDHAKREPS
jgi:hypothetical protein